jgi:hypothetical protein
MKSKASLILGVLVLTLSVVGISAANAAVAPSGGAPQTAAAAPVLPAEGASPFLCNLNRSVGSELPKTGDLVPSPVQTTPPPCGACSAINCAGRQLGAFCGTGPNHQDLHCLDFDLVCSQDGRDQCRCAEFRP